MNECEKKNIDRIINGLSIPRDLIVVVGGRMVVLVVITVTV